MNTTNLLVPLKSCINEFGEKGYYGGMNLI